MKKRVLIGMLCIGMLCLVACGKVENVAEAFSENKPEESIAEEIVFSAEETASAGVEKEITVYYANLVADKLEKEQIVVDQFEEINVESVAEILEALARHNIVSIDSKVIDFRIEEDQKKYLYLDMNKAYGEYLKTMGATGENVILAALVDTFLENWKADGIVITVEGTPLETSQGVYEEAFSYMEIQANDTVEEQDMRIACEWEEVFLETADTEHFAVTYPQILEMEDLEVQKKINDLILDYVQMMYQAEGLESATDSYEIIRQEDQVTILFTGSTCGKNAEYAVEHKIPLHFLLKDGSMSRLTNFADAELVAKKLQNYEDLKLIRGELDEEAYTAFIEKEYPDLMSTLENMDIQSILGNLSVSKGYSYMREGKLYILLKAPHEAGDYVEIELANE